jgi:segregation and condensation protein A
VEAKLDLSNLTLADLLAAAESAFAQEQEKQALGTVITAPKVTIREKIALIAEKLGEMPHARFGDLIGKTPTRLEVVVTFLALLELVKRYRVAARQEALFGEIEIDRADDWDPNDELELEFE